ncbi:MAG: polysaccharide pyruvyl transferase family protein [Anaerovoracaceae bacterium]
MKYGLLWHKTTTNLGDDIQSYALEQFLPHTDYLLNREHLNEFISHDKEPVAAIMSAWWMWEKWNWPPTKYIIPHFVGFHYSNNKLAKQPGCPCSYDFLTGLGGDYLNAHGPIGVRDDFTEENMKINNIDSFFSGCITLTLPKKPKREVEKPYICIVDTNKAVEKRLTKQAAKAGLDVKVMNHYVDYSKDSSTWEERKKIVEEVLTVYQNAQCVFTRRLHCALPCLAIGTPVCLVIRTPESIRFSPYRNWLHTCTPRMYLDGEFEYSIVDPPANKTEHLKYREELKSSINDFVKSMEEGPQDLQSLVKVSYTDKEIQAWRYPKMVKVLNQWAESINSQYKELKTLEASAPKKKKGLKNTIKDILKGTLKIQVPAKFRSVPKNVVDLPVEQLSQNNIELAKILRNCLDVERKIDGRRKAAKKRLANSKK